VIFFIIRGISNRTSDYHNNFRAISIFTLRKESCLALQSKFADIEMPAGLTIVHVQRSVTVIDSPAAMGKIIPGLAWL
jgi:hypothetical protein